MFILSYKRHKIVHLPLGKYVCEDRTNPTGFRTKTNDRKLGLYNCKTNKFLVCLGLCSLIFTQNRFWQVSDCHVYVKLLNKLPVIF